MKTSVVLLATALFIQSTLVHSHFSADVGDYVFSIGFLTEPAWTFGRNGVDLTVRDRNSSLGVSGVQDWLDVIVTHEATGISRTFDLVSVYGQVGKYKAEFTPTLSGVYTFRFVGPLEGIDESFTCGNGFHCVEDGSASHFPSIAPNPFDVAENLTLALQTANEALKIAQDALALAGSQPNRTGLLSVDSFLFLGALFLVTKLVLRQ